MLPGCAGRITFGSANSSWGLASRRLTISRNQLNDRPCLYLKALCVFSVHEPGLAASDRTLQPRDRERPEIRISLLGLADTYLVAGADDAIPAEEALTRGKAAAARALELDDSLAGAHYALATAYTWYDWDWRNAERKVDPEASTR